MKYNLRRVYVTNDVPTVLANQQRELPFERSDDSAYPVRAVVTGHEQIAETVLIITVQLETDGDDDQTQFDFYNDWTCHTDLDYMPDLTFSCVAQYVEGPLP